MICQNELRIGNYIQSWKYCQQKARVVREYIPVTALVLMDIEKNTWYYHPIMLSENWLLGFGFTEHTDRFFIYNRVYNHPLTPAIEYRTKYEWKSRLLHVSLKEVKIVQMLYVHQLQNFFFLLKGVELET